MNYKTTRHRGPHKLLIDWPGVWHTGPVVQKMERGVRLLRNRQVSGRGPWFGFKAVVSVNASWECPSISRGGKYCTASFRNVLELASAEEGGKWDLHTELVSRCPLACCGQGVTEQDLYL